MKNMEKNSKSPERVKNMIKIKDEKQKLIESASLVIKSPTGRVFGSKARQPTKVANDEAQKHHIDYSITPKKAIQNIETQPPSQKQTSEISRQDRRGSKATAGGRDNSQNPNQYGENYTHRTTKQTAGKTSGRGNAGPI